MDRFSHEAVSRAAGIRLLLLDVDGVLTDGTIYLDNHGVEAKGFNIMDGLGLNLLGKAGIRAGVITGRNSEVVAFRARELNLSIVVQGCSDKLAAARAIAEDEGLRLDQVAYVGDDLIDLKLLGQVGLAVSVPGGAEEVKAVAHHVTRAAGGRGAVREVCELILKAQKKWNVVLERHR